jgi:hypothetical protein
MSTLMCPRCEAPLERRSAKDRVSGVDLSVHTCPRCGGAWVPAEPLERLFGWLRVESERRAAALLCPSCGAVAREAISGAAEHFACNAGCGSFVEAQSLLALSHERSKRSGKADALVEGGGYRVPPRSAQAVPPSSCVGCARPVADEDLLFTRFGPQCARCRASLAVQVRLGTRQFATETAVGPSGEQLVVCRGCHAVVPRSPFTLGECDPCFLLRRLERAAEDALLDAAVSPRQRRARKWYADTVRPLERTWRRLERRLRRAWQRMG